MSIDTSGPEFFDRSPTPKDFRRRIAQSGHFRQSDHGWMSELAAERIKGGGTYRSTLQAIVRSGDLLSKDEIKALGFHSSRKVGRDFAEAISSGDTEGAVVALETLIHHASFRAVTLHNLRRSQDDAGVELVTFCSPQDERSTDLERRLEGKEMTIAAARKLVEEHEAEICRSYFRAVIMIDGERF